MSFVGAAIFGAAVELQDAPEPEPWVEARTPEGGAHAPVTATPGPETDPDTEP
jgi:hypothetical protein